ncbi:cullin-5-like isoform X2 [Panonychus citri]|uniref:cullin-5-like isoform X2 n=1 Tax=Panonychus citri TaxID=50023 RepID=UPI002307B169|nr:cullin-5-like isoform X2 [Panonychus citri]
MTKFTFQQKIPQLEDHWPSMRQTILKLLHQQNVSQLEWQELFWNVHNVVQWDQCSDKLHESLQQDILEFISQAQSTVLAHHDDQALLKAYVAAWSKFFVQCNYLPLPFTPLMSNQKSNNSKTTTIEENIVRKLMHTSWNESIFSNIKHRLQNSAMKLVHAERNGEAFDSQLVIGVRESYVNLCSNSNDKAIYKENFEKAYLEATETFYHSKAAEYLVANGVQNYMIWADMKLKEEEMRGAKYLESLSLPSLNETCVRVLVTNHKDVILAECPTMIQNNETKKLNLMFRLLDRVEGGVEPMLTYLEDHIVQQGLADMMASAEIITQDSEKYVEQLLELFVRFSTLVAEAFNDDPRLLTARDKAFKQVVNDTSVFKLELASKPKITVMITKLPPESRCPEMLANYCDMLLRKTPLSRRLTSEEIETKLKEVLLVLKYVQNKDVFMRYHKAHLTRRLILDSSADSEKEENMVEWLREVGMPADYVNKLARMFQDIKVSEDLNQQFKNSQRLIDGAYSDTINIKILNVGAWARGSERVQVSLPLELEDFIPEVEEFYKKKHSGRKLQWYHHMSNGTITFGSKYGKYDVDVTTFQMAVLFTWNERPNDKISFENLKLASELPDAELRRTLWSLVAFPKLKTQILLCDVPCKSVKDFTDTTLFWVNQDFHIVKNNKPQRRGKLNLIGRLQLSTEKSREEDNEKIVQLRILRTQEAIVKIMKMRKRITNAQLQTELVEILKNMFLPSKKLIKEQIEWLIDQKYMRRDEDNIGVFVYMA